MQNGGQLVQNWRSIYFDLESFIVKAVSCESKLTVKSCRKVARYIVTLKVSLGGAFLGALTHF